MTQDFASLMLRYAAGSHQPATFQERGVLLPFTTPQLTGARIRPGARVPVELVMCNPAGTDGVYILPWTALPDICSPTLHDRTLWGRASRLRTFTPEAVRNVTLSVAMEGYAGRKAARAAHKARAQGQQARLRVHYSLLLELVRQTEPPGGIPPEQDSATNVERRARAALEQLQTANSISPAEAVVALEEMAQQFVDTGLRRNPTDARLPRLISDITAVIQEVYRWGDQAKEQQERQCAEMLAKSAEVTLRCADATLETVYEAQDQLWPLLQAWKRDPNSIRALVTRPDWILDGWEMICGIWRESSQTDTTLAVADMVTLIAMLPRETRDWINFDAPSHLEEHRSGLRRWRRNVFTNQDWQTGLQADTTYRQEQARAYTP